MSCELCGRRMQHDSRSVTSSKSVAFRDDRLAALGEGVERQKEISVQKAAPCMVTSLGSIHK